MEPFYYFKETTTPQHPNLFHKTVIRAKQEQKQKNYFKNALTQVQIFRLEVLTCGAATRAAAAYIFSSQLYLFPRLLLQICTRGSQQARAWRKASLPFWHLTATCTQSQRAKEMLFFFVLALSLLFFCFISVLFAFTLFCSVLLFIRSFTCLYVYCIFSFVLVSFVFSATIFDFGKIWRRKDNLTRKSLFASGLTVFKN